MTLEKLFVQMKGSSSSGNFGHEGVPGKHGGSAPGGGNASSGKMKTKMTIQKAAKLLQEKGYKLGKPKVDLKAKRTNYEVVDPKGKTLLLSPAEIEEIALS